MAGRVAVAGRVYNPAEVGRVAKVGRLIVSLVASSDFANAAWVKSSSTVNADVTLAPDNTLTADQLNDSAALAVFNVSQAATARPSVFSVWAKPGTKNWVFVGGNSGTIGSYFDVGAGAIGGFSGGVTPTIVPGPNGWYQCSISYKPTDANVSVYVANGNGAAVYLGDGTGNVFLWGAAVRGGRV